MPEVTFSDCVRTRRNPSRKAHQLITRCRYRSLTVKRATCLVDRARKRHLRAKSRAKTRRKKEPELARWKSRHISFGNSPCRKAWREQGWIRSARGRYVLDPVQGLGPGPSEGSETPGSFPKPPKADQSPTSSWSVMVIGAHPTYAVEIKTVKGTGDENTMNL